MISRSCGHSAELYLVSRMAGRTASMIVIDRLRLSSRTVLLLLVLLGTPMAARSDALEDSARELARKIDAALTARGELSCDVRNVSTLEMDDAVRIEQALKTELQGRCVRSQANGSEVATVVVTLSENLESLVWSAEIHQGAADRDILQVVPRSSVPSRPTTSLPIVLASEQFWDGRERVLDVSVTDSPTGGQLLVLLLPDSLLIRNASEGSENKIDLPLAISTAALREPSGSLSHKDGNSIEARRDRRSCTISLGTMTVDKCWDDQDTILAPEEPPLRAGQAVTVATTCSIGRGLPLLVTGTGDDTQPDFVQVIVSRGLGSAVASNRVDFPGPILVIHDGTGREPATVIVKNLRTGNYEAYRLSISCGQ